MRTNCITLAYILLALTLSATAGTKNPNTDWFSQAKFGVFMHYLPGSPTGLKQLGQFDVKALGDQLADLGAGYFVLTLGQNSGFFNSPNAAYDRRTGYAPGERCSTRDLPLELYPVLHAKGIRLMLYLPCQVPNQDRRAQTAFGLAEGPKDQPIDLAFADKWSEVIQDWADRYGDKVAGWWFDGGYQHIGFNDAIAQVYARAAKHGNPQAIVTFNPGVKVIRWTEAEDYTAGELNDPLSVVPANRWLDGSQWHALTYVGDTWGRRNTRFADAQWIDWARKVTTKGGVLTLDMGPNYDPALGPIGTLAEAQVKQVKALGAALRERKHSGQKPSPWDMDLLAKAPRWTALERPKAEGVKAISYSGMPFQGKPARVFAWLGVPAVRAGEKVPAMVLIHGGGGTAFEEWVRLWVGRGYAAIAMDTCGQVPVGNYGHYVHDDQGGPPGWGGFDQIDRPQEEQWTYHAVADAILAHSLIRSLPEVDPERTGVTGISWGGYLTCIVAAVDPRFKLAVPVYGCGFYRETLFEGDLAKLSPNQADRWMALWDPSAYLDMAEMPFLWVTGSNDFAYTMNALQRSYRLPKGPRTLCIRLRMPHGHGGPGENPEEIRVFADGILRAGTPLAVVAESGRDGSNAWVTFTARNPIVRAELNYTKDTGRWQDRKWESVPAQRTGDKFTAGVPDGTKAFYFNLFDERNCVVSTEHQEFSPAK